MYNTIFEKITDLYFSNPFKKIGNIKEVKQCNIIYIIKHETFSNTNFIFTNFGDAQLHLEYLRNREEDDVCREQWSMVKIREGVPFETTRIWS